MVLGLLGGYYAILWGTLKFCINGYEEFKFNNSVVGTVYSASQTGPDKESSESLKRAEEDMKDEVKADGRFFY